MRIKIIGLLFLGMCSQMFFGQNKLSTQLWNKVKECHAMLEDMDGDGKVDYDTLIDDTKNGYLKIAGSWPTCGCSCENTVAAFKKADLSYVFLKEEYLNCSWKYKVTASKPIKTVFPKEIIQDFFAKRIAINDTRYFYLDIVLPQKGTDIKINILPTPIGLKTEMNNPFEFKEEGHKKSFYDIYTLAQRVKEETLIALIEEKFQEIAPEEYKIVEGFIKMNDDLSVEMVSKNLKKIKAIYNTYTKIIYQEIVLKWNRVNGQFEFKNKIKKTKRLTFKQFLMATPYWSLTC